ncbi:MAG: hypothetical protein JWL60_698, partial [Gemmatimonadetes bacterium]|nr:hypothetical protein [Gemmatimonadota bacterium]
PVAGLQVAAGRRAAQARSDTARVVAEQSGTAVSRIAAGAAAAAEPTQQLQGRVAGVTMDVADAGTGQQCFRIESDDPETTWGPVRLPLVVALRGTGSSGVARVTGGTGGETIDAPWRRTAGDTLHLELRRIGYSGAIDLAGGDTVREGTMRSAPAAMQPGQVVTSATGGPASNARRRAAPATRAAATPAAAKASAARSAAAGVAVTARPVRCP